jgi:predicted NAD-dependent protein-ADP-ribosyltransferase YbiA (DUF1768 family)
MISDFHTPSTRFLSNFYVYPVTVFGCLWQSAEHAYQAQKFTTWPAQYARIKAAETPGKAKKLGRDSGIRKDWEQVKTRSHAGNHPSQVPRRRLAPSAICHWRSGTAGR